MRKRYSAALIGRGGIFKALKRAWCTRFETIQGVIMIPETGDKLRLSIQFDARSGVDMVKLTHTNPRTGSDSILYAGKLRDGEPTHKPRKE